MASTVTKKNKSMQQSKHCVANQKLCTLGLTVNKNGTFLDDVSRFQSLWVRKAQHESTSAWNECQFCLLLWWYWATPIVSFKDVIPQKMTKYFFNGKILKRFSLQFVGMESFCGCWFCYSPPGTSLWFGMSQVTGSNPWPPLTCLIC